jgi:bifunctional non-homologous end joining protein LigD
MATRKLAEYERKRRFEATPEPPAEPRRSGRRAKLPRFVVQEHHATRLHWDFRLERDGVLVSWAVPKGIPQDPKRNHLAVHVEDHPLDYIDFAGEIPRGNYGAGQVSIWDHGTYETEKWQIGPRASKQEVMVVLHGERLKGRYVLFQTRGKNWMMHRMDPPQDPERVAMPGQVAPMAAKLADRLPRDEAAWGFEFKWDGIRAIVFSSGGTLKIQSRNCEDITRRYPELRPLSEALGWHEVVLDGEIVALDERGRPSFEVLQQRMGLNADAEIRRKMREVPVVYMIFDLLYLDGRSLLGTPYRERRARLDELALAGSNWQVPPWVAGGGAALWEESKRNGLEGVVAKRLDSLYEPGRRSGAWLKLKNHLEQEFVIGGWLEGEGRRAGLPGALLLGYYQGDELVYAGKVGTGFTERMLEELQGKLRPLAVDANVFAVCPSPVPKAAHFVEPRLVCQVEFNEWTRTGQLRAPSFKGLRPDKAARDVIRERPAS